MADTSRRNHDKRTEITQQVEHRLDEDIGKAIDNKSENNSVNSGVSVIKALTCAACQRAMASASAP